MAVNSLFRTWGKALLLLIPAALFLVVTTQGQSREELERQRRQIQQEIEELRAVQNSIRKDKKASLGQLTLIQRKLAKRADVINNINAQVRLIDNSIFSNNRIQDAQQL